ncbi:tonsoku-like protein isoform X2 [Euwallacea fornicatus]|uniref:tonsoku-like protein isoform X2 n=1 Tax=Euwallacea fornicatus TaxID=995702 RepID=UPI00338DDC75
MEEQKLLKRKQKAASNTAALLSACTDLASYYSSVGQFLNATKEYEVLCRIYKEQKEMLLYAQAQRGLGEAYMGLQNFTKTLQHFKIYHEVAVQEQNTLEQQRALAQLGHLYLTWFLETLSEDNTKLLNEAYGYFVRSMKKCESLSDGLEKQDMIARLFSNLGLVKEYLGDYDTSFQLYEKSIKICLKHDFFEQLYRGYLSLASLFEKQGNFQDTIKNYNLAVEVAKKLSHKRVELICAALLAKSETLIKLADFQGAKQVLRKAYKFKTPNKSEKTVIEKHLKVVAAMCKIEDEIIICNDQKQLKVLYEKMGDGACGLKNFSKAIEYYKKMLEAAERTGVSDKELGECYYSLGETYKDNGDYKEAELYFEKEYDLCKNNLKESLNTMYKIADLKEMAKDGAEQIKAIYERCLNNCRKGQNLKEEKHVAKRYVEFLRRSFEHKEAFKIERRLQSLNEQLGEEEEAESSSSECESEDSTKVPLGENIVLSEVTDISEESDNEVPEKTVQVARRRKQNNIKFKKNLNGEWPLHVACIKGNSKMVKYWLDVDHPVNVRDNAGWLPLHEAAVHGHLDIVRLLLDQKASINDRGGSECNGITPLHDAASNGHLEVVELLLDRGACAVAKTDDGNTPLFELKRWYDRVEDDLPKEQLTLYQSLVKRFQKALDKAGQKDTMKSASDKEIDYNPNVNVGFLRRNIQEVDSSEDEASHVTDKSISEEYQRVMQNLRHKPQKRSPSTCPKRAALIDEAEFVEAEDWLEEDVKQTKNKKRKTGDFISGHNSPAKIANKSPAKILRCSNLTPDTSLQDPIPNQRRYSNASNHSTKKKQVTLLHSGFSTGAVSQNIYSTTSNVHAEADSTSTIASRVISSQNMATQSNPMLFVDVEINNKLFRVPLLLSQLQDRNIKWLAQEAALRYESKEFMMPVLELETVNGAILNENDSLNLLFPMGSLQAEKVIGTVTQWTLSSVLEKYKEICANLGVNPSPTISSFVENLSVSLDLSSRGFLFDDINPLLKSVINQKSLTEINLSGNFLNSQSITLLGSTMGTLPNLEVLNLSCTGLQRNHLAILANSVVVHGSSLERLWHLDISDNINLQNYFLKDLNIIAKHLNLKRLCIRNVGLFEPLNFKVCLKTVEEFDVSYNQLTNTGIKNTMQWLDGGVLRYLNVSRNKAERALRQILDIFGIGLMTMQKIYLEECGVCDSDLFELLRSAPNIESIKASYNPDLTSISLRRLLEHGNIDYINLCYCDNIWTYFNREDSDWSIALKSKAKLKICASEYCGSLEDMFRQRCGEELKIVVKRGIFTVMLNS